MKEINCQACRSEVDEAELGQRLSLEACAHLEACAACRAFRDERLSLRQLVGSLETKSAPAGFDFQLRARLAASEGSRTRRLRLVQNAPGLPAIAIAAAFALLVSASVIVKQFNSNGRTAQQQAFTSGPATASPAKVNSTSAPARDEELALAARESVPAPSASGPVSSMALIFKPRVRASRGLRTGLERLAGSPDVAQVHGLQPRAANVEFSGRAAPVLTLVAVPVSNTSQPVTVSLEDEKGAKRTVSVQPVTFGSQELIEKSGAGRVVVNAPRGIW